MKEYIILTDSTTDLPVTLANEHDLTVMRMKFILNGKAYENYLDNRELDPVVFYDAVKGGAQPTTSQINPEEYLEVMKPILESGKDILLLVFSSALSSTYNSARIATEELQEQYKDRKIILIDTKAASLGEGLLVHLAAKQAKLGKSIDEVAQYVLDMRYKIAHWFTVDDISHLRRGGRISAMSSVIAKLANIKPILHVSNEGKLVARHKALGRKKAIRALFDEMVKNALPGPQTVFIGHGNDLDAAEQLAALIKEKFELEELVINMIGPVIGAHAGQGVLALFFVANER